jgi:hypothetical protein
VFDSIECQEVNIVIVLFMFLQVSTSRLEKFLELPETCSVIPASCNSDQQPETETVRQDVTVVSHSYSKVANNLLSFLWYLSCASRR